MRFNTDVAAIAFYKPGFETGRLALPATSPVRLVRKRREGQFPSCPANARYLDMDMRGPRLRFRWIEGAAALENGRDIDYVTRTYSVKIEGHPKGVRVAYALHGYGPMWSFGMPSDQAVREAASFAGHMLDRQGGGWVSDARSAGKTGRHWRRMDRRNDRVSRCGRHRRQETRRVPGRRLCFAARTAPHSPVTILPSPTPFRR